MQLISVRMDREALLLEETLFHVGNGYLGVRGNLEEGLEDVGSIRGCYINGLYDTVELQYPERLYGFAQQAQRMVNLPDIQTVKIFLDGVELNPQAIQDVAYTRSLDTGEGVARRRMAYPCPTGAVVVTISRMASFQRPELFLTVLEIESNGVAGSLHITAGVDCNVRNYVNPDDPRVAAEAKKHIRFDGADLLADGGLVRCSTVRSGFEIAVVQRFAGEGVAVDSWAQSNGLLVNLTAELAAGERIVVEKHTVVSDSRRQRDPKAHARAVADTCLRLGAPALLAEQKDYLAGFWEAAAVGVEGCAQVQDTLEFNLFELLQSAGRDGISAIAAKGLSGEGYEGHYFWDTEIYVFPFFLFTRPDIARGLLDYRYSILDSAREHAKLLGHQKGALYPWRTIAGSECSAYYPSGSAQYHINGDIAHSFLQYWYATGDLAYMQQKGAEVLVETARLWLEVGHYDESGRFCINTVTGPDEYTCIVNNNYYTNRCAQNNLLGAVEICGALRAAHLAEAVERSTGVTAGELEQFERAALAMHLPYDAQRDIHPQDDSFLQKPIWNLAETPSSQFPLLLHYHPLYLYRHQVCKQADTVLAYMMFEDGVADHTMRNSFAYYERITTHDSSLSRCVYSIVAARLGMPEKAYSYFMDTLRTDLDDMQGNTRDGIHTANLGGSWLALVMGFAGMRLRGDGLHFRFLLPEQWAGIHVQLRYQGRLFTLKLSRERAEFVLKQGEPFQLYVDDRPHRLEDSLVLEGVVR